PLPLPGLGAAAAANYPTPPPPTPPARGRGAAQSAPAKHRSRVVGAPCSVPLPLAGGVRGGCFCEGLDPPSPDASGKREGSRAVHSRSREASITSRRRALFGPPPARGRG